MQFRTIIAAVDLDDDLASSVALAAQSLAQKDNADLEVVTAWPSLSVTAPTFSAEVAASAVTLSSAALEQHKEARANTEKRLQKLMKSYAPQAGVSVIDGDPGEALCDYAKKKGADLIVTGSHQRKFWNSLLQGSASRDLVKEAPCAVFLVTESCAENLSAKDAAP